MFDPWVGKIPWRRKWQPASIFLPGKSQVQRRLEDYSGWCCKELDLTEHAHILGHFFLHGKVKHTGLPLNTVFQGFSEMHCITTAACFELADITSHPIHEPGLSSSCFVSCSLSVTSLKVRHWWNRVIKESGTPVHVTYLCSLELIGSDPELLFSWYDGWIFSPPLSPCRTCN